MKKEEDDYSKDYTHFAEKAVQRFYRNLENSLIEMIKEHLIKKETSVGEVLRIITNKLKGG